MNDNKGLTGRTARALFLLTAFLTPGARAEVGWAPYLNAEIFSGKSFFSSSDDSPVSGPNGSVTFVPGIRFNESFTLLPSLSGRYQTTRDVRELTGGGFLTQEEQAYATSLKAIYRISPQWRIKGLGSYRLQYLKETEDEPWGSGLFDNSRWGASVELEHEGDRLKALRLGLDLSETRFPNFSSLAAGEAFGTEIDAGVNTLDFRAVDLSLAADALLHPGGILSAFALGSLRRFPEQKLVQLTGTYSDDLRNDLYMFGSLGYRRRLPTLSLFGGDLETLAGVDGSYAWLFSDQNNYDASALQFNRNFYDYGETATGTQLNLRYRETWGLGLGVSYAHRDYKDRPVQGTDGVYAREPIWTDTLTARWSLSYVLGRGFSLTFQGAYQDARSNMRNESVYRYNYSSHNHFAGIRYQL